MNGLMDHGLRNAQYNKQMNNLAKIKAPIVNYLNQVGGRLNNLITNPLGAVNEGLQNTYGWNVPTHEQFVQALNGPVPDFNVMQTDAAKEMMGWLPGPMDNIGAIIGSVKKIDNYGMVHRPMTIESGAASIDDLTKSFPEDIYSPQALQFYGSGDPREKFVLSKLWALKGKPEAKVKIYRGIPSDAESIINPGDWVTLDKRVAKEYGEKVIEMEVPAKDVTSWADSLLEFGYYPQSK